MIKRKNEYPVLSEIAKHSFFHVSVRRKEEQEWHGGIFDPSFRDGQGDYPVWKTTTVRISRLTTEISSIVKNYDKKDEIEERLNGLFHLVPQTDWDEIRGMRDKIDNLSCNHKIILNTAETKSFCQDTTLSDGDYIVSIRKGMKTKIGCFYPIKIPYYNRDTQIFSIDFSQISVPDGTDEEEIERLLSL